MQNLKSVRLHDMIHIPEIGMLGPLLGNTSAAPNTQSKTGVMTLEDGLVNWTYKDPKSGNTFILLIPVSNCKYMEVAPSETVRKA